MKKKTLEQILPLGTIVLLKGGNKKNHDHWQMSRGCQNKAPI